MRSRLKVWFFIIGYMALLLMPTPWLALQESTEGRYAEIAREMLVTGNFLEPSLNGISHFHKPPLSYWSMALGMKLFGINDVGARFFSVAAAALCLYFVYKASIVVTRKLQVAWSTVLILAAAPLFLGVSRIVATDIYLTLFVVAAQYFLFKQIYGEKSNRNAYWYGLFLGLGFLTKGPIILLFTLVPFFAAKLIDDRHRNAFTMGQGMAAAGVFAVVALPWYVYVITQHHDLLSYFLNTQTVDRVATDRFARNKPFWFFFVIFATTFLPATFYLVLSLIRRRELPQSVRVLWFYLIIPLAVFSVAKSKMAPYILPFYGIAAIVAAETLHYVRERWVDLATLWILASASVCIAFSGFVYTPMSDMRWLLLLTGIMGMASCLAINRLKGEALARVAAMLVIGICFMLYQALPSLETVTKGYEQMAATMNDLDPERKLETVVYKAFLPSISFYRGRMAVMAMGRHREVEFERNERYRQWYISEPAALRHRLGNEDGIFLVTEPQNMEEFRRETGMSCRIIFTQRKYSAYYCSHLVSRPAPVLRMTQATSSAPQHQTRQ